MDVTSGIGGSGVGINDGFEANDELEEKEQDESDNGEDVGEEMTMTKKLKSKLPKERGKLKLRM